tara:strand:+ start:4512 stop:5858 length:1347 start_codon:yes stop_codon:yes gene_type:complete
MSNISGGSTSYLQIDPSNIVSTGRVSYRDGNPVINFIIGETDRFLIGSSLRICGNISCYTSSSGDTGVVPLPSRPLNVSPKLGAYGMIEQVVLSSQKTKNVIEHVRHYGRFLASYLPNVSSQQEAIGHLSTSSGMMPNSFGNKLSFVNNVNGSIGGTSEEYSGNSFCLNLPTGFLNNKEPIGLSGKGWGIGGLSIDIHLAPDSQFFNNASTDLNAFYQLTNLKLLCEVINPAPDELSRLMSQSSTTMEYNAISSYYTTVNSTNAIINFRLGLSRVLGVFINFIPSTYLNNIQQDGYQTTPLINNLALGEIAPIKQVIWLKGGSQVPLEFNVDTNVKDNAASVVADPQLVRGIMNTFVPFMKNKNSQLTPTTYNRVGFKDFNDFADAGLMFGVGVQYDNISGDGLDFRTDNFGVQMETGLTADNPHSAFIFVRSKQTLVMNANGLQVLS